MIALAIVLGAAICLLLFLLFKATSQPQTRNYEQRLEELRQDRDRLLADGRAEADKRVAEAKADAEKQLAETKAEAEKRLAQTKADAEKQLAQAKTDAEKQLAQAKTDAEKQLAQNKADAERRIAEIKADNDKLVAQLKADHEADKAQERKMLEERFKALATDIMRSNSHDLDEKSRKSLETVLAPMQEHLALFTKNFRECYDFESRERGSLREEIKALHNLNKQVSLETSRLSNALKGNTRVQGQWGEMILKNILENSGLEESRWFITQESTTTESGERLRPDAIIRCPGSREIIIDSKTSLTHYLSMLDADNDDDRRRLADAHVRSVENHVSELRKKEYQDHIGAKKGDFVMMFMPHEGAYMTALQHKPDLWMKAYESRVIIVSPTHLVTVVHLVEQMWLTEKQTKNTLKIASEASKLLDSVAAFLADMKSVGDNLDKSKAAYDNALKRLTTGNNNVVRVATGLKELGVKSKKELPDSMRNDD